MSDSMIPPIGFFAFALFVIVMTKLVGLGLLYLMADF